MIPFDEIDSRLERVGKDRAWLASETSYSATYLRDLLAPKSNRRTDRVQKIISDAIEREEARRNAVQAESREALKQHAITIYPSRAQFNRWTHAFKHSESETLEAWAENRLDDAATEWERDLIQSQMIQLPETARTKFEIPLWHAAAGLPASADVETVEVERDYGHGRMLCQLHGDSMEPKFKDGTQVVLRARSTLRSPFLKKGEIYLFSLEGQNLLKEYNTRKATQEEIDSRIAYQSPSGTPKVRVLRSINSTYNDIVAAEDVDWIGWYDKADN